MLTHTSRLMRIASLLVLCASYTFADAPVEPAADQPVIQKAQNIQDIIEDIPTAHLVDDLSTNPAPPAPTFAPESGALESALSPVNDDWGGGESITEPAGIQADTQNIAVDEGEFPTTAPTASPTPSPTGVVPCGCSGGGHVRHAASCGCNQCHHNGHCHCCGHRVKNCVCGILGTAARGISALKHRIGHHHCMGHHHCKSSWGSCHRVETCSGGACCGRRHGHGCSNHAHGAVAPQCPTDCGYNSGWEVVYEPTCAPVYGHGHCCVLDKLAHGLKSLVHGAGHALHSCARNHGCGQGCGHGCGLGHGCGHGLGHGHGCGHHGCGHRLHRGCGCGHGCGGAMVIDGYAPSGYFIEPAAPSYGGGYQSAPFQSAPIMEGGCGCAAKSAATRR